MQSQHCLWLQEELRLAHVAVTRARHRLFITSHRINEGALGPNVCASLAQKQAAGTPVHLHTFSRSAVPLPKHGAEFQRFVHPQSDPEKALRWAAEQSSKRPEAYAAQQNPFLEGALLASSWQCLAHQSPRC